MKKVTDQLGNNVVVSSPPKRIVSLVPSQTELLFDLGLNQEVVGITKFCIHPNEWFKTKQRIGGTKTINIDIVKSLKPDLIIANKEENVKAQIEELQKHFPVWLSDVTTLEDALQMIRSVGELVNKETQANKIANKIISAFETLPVLANKIKTAYFIWKDPYMAAGNGTFINEMLQRIGLDNVYSNASRYPEVTMEELSRLECQLLLLSSEPFPFKEKHIEDLKFQLPDTKIVLVDGEMFSWYGSRLQLAPDYFRSLFPDLTEI